MRHVTITSCHFFAASYTALLVNSILQQHMCLCILLCSLTQSACKLFTSDSGILPILAQSILWRFPIDCRNIAMFSADWLTTNITVNSTVATCLPEERWHDVNDSYGDKILCHIQAVLLSVRIIAQVKRKMTSLADIECHLDSAS